MQELYSPENALNTIIEQIGAKIRLGGLEIFDADDEELAIIRTEIGLQQNVLLIVVESEKGLTQTKLHTLTENVATLSSSLYDVKFVGEEKMTVGYIIITPKLN